MADNVLDAFINNFVRYRHGLFRVAGIVELNANQLIAFNSALRVNVFNGLPRAVELHVAPLSYRAGHRTDHGNFNILSHDRVRHRQCNESRNNGFCVPFHASEPRS